jgi:hypothetical protein
MELSGLHQTLVTLMPTPSEQGLTDLKLTNTGHLLQMSAVLVCYDKASAAASSLHDGHIRQDLSVTSYAFLSL